MESTPVADTTLFRAQDVEFTLEMITCHPQYQSFPSDLRIYRPPLQTRKPSLVFLQTTATPTATHYNPAPLSNYAPKPCHNNPSLNHAHNQPQNLPSPPSNLRLPPLLAHRPPRQTLHVLPPLPENPPLPRLRPALPLRHRRRLVLPDARYGPPLRET